LATRDNACRENTDGLQISDVSVGGQMVIDNYGVYVTVIG